MEHPLHIQRVIAERDELADRKTKLNAFFNTDMFASLHPDEQADMKSQAAIMANYEAVLNSRLDRAGVTEQQVSTLDSGGGGGDTPPPKPH